MYNSVSELLKDFIFGWVPLGLSVYSLHKNEKSQKELMTRIKHIEETLVEIQEQTPLNEREQIDLIFCEEIERFKIGKEGVNIYKLSNYPIRKPLLSIPINKLDNPEKLTIYIDENLDILLDNKLILPPIPDFPRSNSNLKLYISPYYNHFSYSQPIIIPNLKGKWSEIYRSREMDLVNGEIYVKIELDNTFLETIRLKGFLKSSLQKKTAIIAEKDEKENILLKFRTDSECREFFCIKKIS